MAPSDKQQPSDQSSELTADRDISDAINAFGKKYETAQEGRPEHDREILKWTKGAGIGVCFYTLLTFALTTLAFCQLQETKHSLVADTRAWVGPYEVSIDAFGPQSKTTNLVLKYKNAGKEPALNFNDSYNDDWTGTVDDSDKLDFTKNCFADDPNGKPSEETCADRINRWLKTNCERKAPYEQRVVYPDFSDTASNSSPLLPIASAITRLVFCKAALFTGAI